MNSDRGGHAGELQRSFRLQDFGSPGGIITRERSFVRPQSHHQNYNQMRDPTKRKSMVVTNANNRGKPTMEIYRPPIVMSGVRVDSLQQANNKLNVHAKEFTMARQNEIQMSKSNVNIPNNMHFPRTLHHSKSSGNVLQHVTMQNLPPMMPPSQTLPSLYQTMVQPPMMRPLLTSASSGNILHTAPRVHFKLPVQNTININNNLNAAPNEKKKYGPINGQPFNGVDKTKKVLQSAPLKRSKSLTSTDTMASGRAALGLTTESMDLGSFPPEIQENIDKAMEDPNQLCARTLMELCNQIMKRAVESSRYSLAAARHCISIIEKEKNQTFLESLLNACQQWYQDRDKMLNVMIGGCRPRLVAFISLLLELFMQLRQLSTQSLTVLPGNLPQNLTAPTRALLTLICKCCEECIRASVPSASDTENLFFVLTFIGRDLETQLPTELESLLAAVRDAFLNSSATPAVTKTLLQLIELHASHWQLPGRAVLYYYPSAKDQSL